MTNGFGTSAASTITVDGFTAERWQEFYRAELSWDNASDAVYDGSTCLQFRDMCSKGLGFSAESDVEAKGGLRHSLPHGSATSSGETS
ncbi:MAG: hypothetical protein KAS72_03495 [Phycisphaerales bacterium]|nr:hypothetical protein [Phycisphaerales bacterium]